MAERLERRRKSGPSRERGEPNYPETCTARTGGLRSRSSCTLSVVLAGINAKFSPYKLRRNGRSALLAPEGVGKRRASVNRHELERSTEMFLRMLVGASLVITIASCKSSGEQPPPAAGPEAAAAADCSGHQIRTCAEHDACERSCEDDGCRNACHGKAHAAAQAGCWSGDRDCLGD